MSLPAFYLLSLSQSKHRHSYLVQAVARYRFPPLEPDTATGKDRWVVQEQLLVSPIKT